MRTSHFTHRGKLLANVSLQFTDDLIANLQGPSDKQEVWEPSTPVNLPIPTNANDGHSHKATPMQKGV